ncbi:MAG TPA: hypothetical protein VFF57_00025 [Hanamia sp.]|nr:hypothetical protein [Hanamia sp.]
MVKSLLLLITCAFFITTAQGNSVDTSIIYFKFDLKGYHRVSTLDEADFFRLILPTEADGRVNLKEYYKNGKLKLVGKYVIHVNTTLFRYEIPLTGDIIGYSPNGKRQYITTYNDTKSEGVKYLYYPNGTIYNCMKYSYPDRVYNEYNEKKLYWECYDSSGAQICREGNGQWLEYDGDFKSIVSSGPVKKGYMEGEWHCQSQDADSIKYICRYKKGVLVSGIGYDKQAIAYPFKQKTEWANYGGGPATFIEVFKRHLTLPKGPDGKKMLIDTVHVSFIIEKDGRVTGFKTLEGASPEFKGALSEALAKCHDWKPARLYGIPVRSEIILPLNILQGLAGDANHQNFYFQTRIIGF